jgi:hypothetical protein
MASTHYHCSICNQVHSNENQCSQIFSIGVTPPCSLQQILEWNKYSLLTKDAQNRLNKYGEWSLYISPEIKQQISILFTNYITSNSNVENGFDDNPIRDSFRKGITRYLVENGVLGLKIFSEAGLKKYENEKCSQDHGVTICRVERGDSYYNLKIDLDYNGWISEDKKQYFEDTTNYCDGCKFDRLSLESNCEKKCPLKPLTLWNYLVLEEEKEA